VVYESAGELWLLDDLDADAARRLDVPLGGPRTGARAVPDHAASWLGRGAGPHRAHEHRRGPRHRAPAHPPRTGRPGVLLAEPGVRARQARPLGEDRAVWVDDADGEDAVVIAPLDPHAEDAAPLARHGSGEVGRVLELAPSPDGAAVALPRTTAGCCSWTPRPASCASWPAGADGEVSDLCWSPDSAWLAYCDPVESGLTRIMMARLADDTLVAVTAPRFVDAEPVFTSDGRYLAFLSRRSFDPIYDEHSFDLTFPASWRPFLVPLAARTPSPFGASPTGGRSSGATRARGPAAPTRRAARRRRGEAAEEEKKTARTSRRRSSSTSRGWPTRVVPIPVARAATAA
jgi:tricorn protease